MIIKHALCLAIMMSGVTLQGAETSASADEILQREDLAAYHGWIKYLQFEAEHAAERFPNRPETENEKVQRLKEWTERILANPNVLQELRGTHEWAYESPADGSGQPFKFNIPTDYDPAVSFPVSLYMHGYSGNHLEHATGMEDHPAFFDVSVLGRARGGRYVGLSEVDVLHVLDYLEAHWNIDLDRVHLNGGSMGGGGTFLLGSRYPHRFASGRTVCGYASDKPIGNLLTFPIYATHSDDDYTVPVVHSRGPLARLREIGGQVIFDETTGYGHAVWDYAEGNARGDAWYRNQIRPDSRTVRRIDFTALDGTAARGWWAEVAEWGPRPRPARFILVAGADNVLHAELTNIRRLNLRLAESPMDRTLDLQVSVNGAIPIRLPAPLPDSVVLAADGDGWAFEPRPPELPFVLHTPGGANQLFDGSPLLIVYGTGGSPEAQSAMKEAADVASRSGNAAWLSPNGEEGDDGVSHNQLLYGNLRVAADAEVTKEDIARCHLVLIGSADQNVVVARIADRLPVAYRADTITFNDGFSVPAGDAALGLLHYNPESPRRLIFWVASNDPRTYAADSSVPTTLGPRSWAIAVNGTDCVVAKVSSPSLVASRSFASRWEWAGARDDTPLLPEAIQTGEALANAFGDVLRRASGSDFAVTGATGAKEDAAYVAGTTRLSDLLNLGNVYYNRINVMEMTGDQLIAADRKIADKPVWIHPTPHRSSVERKATYKVAIPSSLISDFFGAAKFAPDGYRITDLNFADELERLLPVLEASRK